MELRSALYLIVREVDGQVVTDGAEEAWGQPSDVVPGDVDGLQLLQPDESLVVDVEAGPPPLPVVRVDPDKHKVYNHVLHETIIAFKMQRSKFPLAFLLHICFWFVK